MRIRYRFRFEQIKDQIENAQEELHEFSANVESDNSELSID